MICGNTGPGGCEEEMGVNRNSVSMNYIKQYSLNSALEQKLVRVLPENKHVFNSRLGLDKVQAMHETVSRTALKAASNT